MESYFYLITYLTDRLLNLSPKMLFDRIFTKTNLKKDSVSEKPLRSIAKAISWRIVGTLDTILISFFLTGQIETALAIGSIELITKMVLYYGHERIWTRIKLGKN